jgi:type I restriction enzyme S subunit
VSWPLIELGEVATFINGDRGKNYPSKGSFIKEGIPFISAGNLADEELNPSSFNYISEDRYNLLSNGKVKENDILFCLRGSLGKFGVVKGIERGAIASSLVIIRNNEKINLNFLKHYIGSPLCRREINQFENGAAQPNLSAKDLKSFKIPLPPLDEQKRIATILDKADAIRRKRQQAIQLADDFLRSVFLDMFGDPLVNSKKWNLEALGELTTKITDGKHGDCENESDSGYYFISAKDVNHGIINYQNTRQINKKEFDEVHRRTDLKSGDIVMVNTGATIGRVAIVRDDERNKRTTFQKSVAIIKLDKKLLNPTFLKFIFLLRIKDFASVGSGSAIKNLLLSKMREFPIIVPPLELQKDFEKIVLKMEQSSINKEECEECKLELFNSLSQKAFAGEL